LAVEEGSSVLHGKVRKGRFWIMIINVEGLADSSFYDERNLVRCKCGKHYYPSKKMFVEFLKQYEDINAEVYIWSVTHLESGEVEIHVDLKYKISDARGVSE